MAASFLFLFLKQARLSSPFKLEIGKLSGHQVDYDKQS